MKKSIEFESYWVWFESKRRWERRTVREGSNKNLLRSREILPSVLLGDLSSNFIIFKTYPMYEFL